MFCSKCGANMPENSAFCMVCGTPVNQANSAVSQPVQQPVNIKNYLVESIIVTLLCCLPFGIVGIIYACKVNTMIAANDIQGAQNAAQTAKKWVIAGFVCGLVFSILYTLLSFLSVMAEA